jgi:hypothetical protein
LFADEARKEVRIMKCPLLRITPWFLVAAWAMAAGPASESTLPNETLRYSINWPTGLSLGEATLSASSAEEIVNGHPLPQRIHLRFDLDAGVPGFAVNDRFRSLASQKFCSAEFQKTTSHGSKKVDDSETFDPNTGTVTRGSGDGQSEISANACGKDALTFLYFVRQELSQGRVPAKQTVFFGAPYEIKLESAGTESLKIGNKSVDTDHFKVTADGPSSSISFDLFLLEDKARTPVLVRVPLALGTFSMELAR